MRRKRQSSRTPRLVSNNQMRFIWGLNSTSSRYSRRTKKSMLLRGNFSRRARISGDASTISPMELKRMIKIRCGAESAVLDWELFCTAESCMCRYKETPSGYFFRAIAKWANKARASRAGEGGNGSSACKARCSYSRAFSQAFSNPCCSFTN